MHSLPQAGILANKLLKKHLTKHGYFEVSHTPGLWKHVSHLLQFTLVVDYFGIKYIGKEYADHLLNVLNEVNYSAVFLWIGVTRTKHSYLNAQLHQKTTPILQTQMLQAA